MERSTWCQVWASLHKKNHPNKMFGQGIRNNTWIVVRQYLCTLALPPKHSKSDVADHTLDILVAFHSQHSAVLLE